MTLVTCDPENRKRVNTAHLRNSKLYFIVQNKIHFYATILLQVTVINKVLSLIIVWQLRHQRWNLSTLTTYYVWKNKVSRFRHLRSFCESVVTIPAIYLVINSSFVHLFVCLYFWVFYQNFFCLLCCELHKDEAPV